MHVCTKLPVVCVWAQLRSNFLIIRCGIRQFYLPWLRIGWLASLYVRTMWAQSDHKAVVRRRLERSSGIITGKF